MKSVGRLSCRRRLGAGGQRGLRDRRPAFRQFGLGDELAEILVAGARGDEERDDAAVFHCDLGADAGADLLLAGCGVETRCAVNAVAVEHRDGGQLKPTGLGCEILGR